MSNPTVSLRISNYHLARGLRAIRTLEPNWRLTTTSDLIRTIFIDYIAKSENLNKAPHDIPTELLQEIAYSRAGMNKNPLQNDQFETLPILGQSNQPNQAIKQTQKPAWQVQQEINQEKAFNEMRQESLEKLAKQEQQDQQSQRDIELKKQIELAHQTSKQSSTQSTKIKPSEFHDPNITESTISSVTDFSPPPDWKK